MIDDELLLSLLDVDDVDKEDDDITGSGEVVDGRESEEAQSLTTTCWGVRLAVVGVFVGVLH